MDKIIKSLRETITFNQEQIKKNEEEIQSLRVRQNRLAATNDTFRKENHDLVRALDILETSDVD